MTTAERTTTTRRIVVVDDHDVVRQGLVRVLERRPDYQVVAQAGTAAEAIEAADRYRPGLVIMEVRLSRRLGHRRGRLRAPAQAGPRA